MHIYVIRKRSLYIAALLIVTIIIGLLILYGLKRDRTVSNIQLKYSYQRLLPEEAHSLIQNNPNVVILDVRSVKEFEKGHINNATALPLKELRGEIHSLDREKAYVLYCENGKDSLKASKLMAESGFPRVYTITGGYEDWPFEITKDY